MAFLLSCCEVWTVILLILDFIFFVSFDGTVDRGRTLYSFVPWLSLDPSIYNFSHHESFALRAQVFLSHLQHPERLHTLAGRFGRVAESVCSRQAFIICFLNSDGRYSSTMGGRLRGKASLTFSVCFAKHLEIILCSSGRHCRNCYTAVALPRRCH